MSPLLFLSSVLPKPHAYLDPGSGSIIIQLLLAIGAGILFAVKIYWNRIKQLFTGKEEEASSPDFLIDERPQEED